jgi:2-oxoglutarate ferredoxin oxidoreductase subunit alpha
MGQLKTVLRDQFLVDAKSLTKVSGHPFRIAEIEAAIDAQLGADSRARVEGTTLATSADLNR